ncbi:hypothetical protein [Candidatus Leptofilum sp.]|uniref:hypothetical protein n=1 Tax=Candidatus Leptofilum sp. TaxID=3241576 RepID=UPI003B5C14EF
MVFGQRKTLYPVVVVVGVSPYRLLCQCEDGRMPAATAVCPVIITDRNLAR